MRRKGERHPKNRTRFASLDKLAADPRVEDIWDEGRDGIWVSLADGYLSSEDTTQLHESTPREILDAFKWQIEPQKWPK